MGLGRPQPVDRATPPRVHRHEIKPPPIEDVLRVLERATASRNPENALVFRLLASTGWAGGARSAPCSGTTSTSTPSRCGW
jgi:hypothetical protein